MTSLRRFIPLILLSIGTLILWCAITHRWSLDAWSTPLHLHGDPLEVYARIQIAKEDPSQPLRGFASLPRLGAPMEADWQRYPISDRVVFTGLGWLARFVGVFGALNLAIAAVHVLNAVAFYLCARMLRWRLEWAMAFALLFSFSNYNFRWSVTLSFSLTFFVPLLLLLCGWIARSAPAVASKRWTWIGVGLGAWLGGANPYLSFFASQLVVGSVGLQLLRRREFPRWRVGAIFIGVLAASFALHHAAYFLADSEAEGRLTLSRNYAGSEIYALKISDLVIPDPSHPIPWLANAGRAYHAQSALRTEFFANYLGIAALCGLGLLLWQGVRAVARPARRTRIPDSVLGVAWTLIFSAVGGINSLLALGGFDLFRASSRNSIFILVWALFYLGSWSQRRWRPASPVLRYALPLGIALLSLPDLLPRLRPERLLRANGLELAHYRHVTQALESRLAADALIFQVPSPVFPEAGPTLKMDDYENFLPYLTSTQLRFSYGALRGTDLARALSSLERLPASQIKDELESTGFSAIWIDRRGVPNDGAPLIDSLRQLGLEEFHQDSLSHIAIFFLNPANEPRPLDLSNPKFFEPWDPTITADQPGLVAYDGWFDFESGLNVTRRWAQSVASIGITTPVTIPTQLSFTAYSLKEGELVLELDGREISRFQISPRTRDKRTLRLDLSSMRQRLVWRFSGPLVRPGGADGRLLGFAVENLRLSDTTQTHAGN